MINNYEDDRSSGKKKDKKKKKPIAMFWKVLAGLAMVGVIIGCICTCYLTIFVFDVMENGEVIELNLDSVKFSYTSLIYAENKETGTFEEIHRLESHDGSRIWVDYDDMPSHIFDVLISVEDKRFMEHSGVDWQRTVFSFVNLVAKKFGIHIYEGTPGASTLTQQLVKNLTKDNEVSVNRKLREIFRALNMERHYSKDQILESYLNTAPFGNNTNGIQAAANLYFDKDVKDLTVAECASIIGITKEPTYYNPYTNYEVNQKRKNDILFLMHEQGRLNDQQYKESLDEKIVFNTENNTVRVTNQQNYFIDFLMEQVINDLASERGITYKEAEKQLYNGGLRIYSTVDTQVQKSLEKVYENPEEYMPKVSNKDEYPQSAFIITDPNGAIKGIVGGIGKKEGARVWNRATDTKRQPGSTIKPITSYVLSIENDLVNWSSLLLDGPYQLRLPNQPPWTPRNYYGHFKGYMILEEALQRSTNLIPVRLIEMITPKAAWQFLHNTLGMKSLEESDIAPSPMALGALTKGVTLLEMAGAYQMFANGGTYTPPYTYTKVLDSAGNVILQRNTSPTRVISYETATIMNKLLQRVVTGPYGTGARASLANTNPGIPVAGKTGTTDADVDQWFIGMTPYYVGVCWMGFDDQIKTTTLEDGTKVPVKDAAGNNVPHSILYKGVPYPPPVLWKTVMSLVHEGYEAKNFPASSNVVAVNYCLETGYVATEFCEHRSTGWYKSTNIPTACPLHGFGIGEGYHIAGQKPWADPDAMLEDQWAFVYLNEKQLKARDEAIANGMTPEEFYLNSGFFTPKEESDD